MEMNRSLTNAVPHINTGLAIGSVHAATESSHHSTNGNGNVSSATTSHGPLDNLPKKFVSSMRTLFDIMDDKKTGFVKLVDIEARWQGDAKGLPHGVIDCLRRVTPVSGMLSFERFCAGLKICLLRNQITDCKHSRRSSTDSNSLIASNNSSTSNNGASTISTNGSHLNEVKPPRPPSAPLLDLNNAVHQWNSNNTAAIRPNNALPVQRTLSLPKLSPSSDGDSSSEHFMVPNVYPPPKPPRTALLLGNNTATMNHLSRFDKAEIRHALQNWQMGVIMNEIETKDKRHAMAIPNTNPLSRGNADGSLNLIMQQPQQMRRQQSQSPTMMEYQKNSSARRREPRRHTLQNGVEYNLLKRLRHYEEEKELLLDGLRAVEKAQEWYFKQIALVQEKIKYLGSGDTHLVSLCPLSSFLCCGAFNQLFSFPLSVSHSNHTLILEISCKYAFSNNSLIFQISLLNNSCICGRKL